MKILLVCSLFFEILLCLHTTLFCAVINVPKDFEIIQEAIDEAKKGDTILVSQGVYYENIRMKDGLTLEGVDVEHTIISDSGKGPPGPIVELSCDCTLKNFTITGARGAGVGHTVVVLNGNPKILNNIIHGNSYTAIGVHSQVSKVSVYIAGNIVSDNGGAGVSSLGVGVTVNIVNNKIFGNNNLGVVALDGSTIFVKRNEIRENGVGIVAKTGGRAYVDNNIIDNNKTVGVVVKEKGFAELRSNKLTRNGTPGINVDNSTANLYDNDIVENGTIGIYYKNKSKGIIEENEIASIIPGLMIIYDSELKINRNRIIGAAGIKNTITIKNSKVEFGENKLVGGINTDDSSTIKLYDPPRKVGFGCLGL